MDTKDIRGFFEKKPLFKGLARIQIKKNPFYAVRRGQTTGIFETWEECEQQVKGFTGASYKSFDSKAEAEEWLAAAPTVLDMLDTLEMPDEEPLNPEQQDAYDAIMSGKSIFLTGPGGTGKSFLLQRIERDFKAKTGRKIAVTAMTGCAALLLGPYAKTLHSWAGVGLGRGTVEELVAAILLKKKSKATWKTTSCLVLDEVSMLTPELLEKLDQIGRQVRGHLSSPFGGMQVVFVGDFFQLPPVVKGSQGAFAFESPLWPTIVKKTIELTTIVRQKDPVFQKILNEARIGALSKESYEVLLTRKTKAWRKLEIKPTMLFTKNTDVNSINENSLAKLESEEHVFEVKTIKTKYFPEDVVRMLIDKLDKDASYVQVLSLKVGAQVMVVTNLDPETGLVNGSRGVVTDFAPDGSPVVKFVKSTVVIRPHKWEADGKDSGLAREQIPLKLAYAITIHKAQGATLDCALVDVGPATFEYGQAYVALSRARSLDALYIHDIDPGAFRAHPTVKAFYEQARS